MGITEQKRHLRVLLFGGQEETYQSWYGTPEARLNNDPTALQAVIDNSGEYNTNEQIDNLLNSDRNSIIISMTMKLITMSRTILSCT